MTSERRGKEALAYLGESPFHVWMNRKILCIDDEESILKGLKLHLSREFDLVTASDGTQGLETFQQEGPFAVVVSDMRMPGMDGATTLSKIKEIDPNAVGILLTGHADFEFGGSQALSTGKLFRILNKPCPPEKLKHAIEEGIKEFAAKSSDGE